MQPEQSDINTSINPGQGILWGVLSPLIFLSAIYFLFANDFVVLQGINLSWDTALLVAGVPLLLVATLFFLMAVRWYFCARFLSVPLSFKKILFIFPFSMLGAMIFLGPLGGDFIRFVMLKLSSDQSKVALFGTVLLDRVLSLGGIIGAILSYLFIFAVAAGDTTMMAIVAGVIGAGALLAVFLAGVCRYLHRNGKVIDAGVVKLSRLLNAIVKFVAELTPQKTGLLIVLAALSTVLAMFAGLIVTLSAIFLLNLDLDLLQSSFAAVVGNLASIVPLTPGGVGFGEMGFQEAMSQVTTAETAGSLKATPYFIFRILNITTGAVLSTALISVWFLRNNRMNKWQPSLK